MLPPGQDGSCLGAYHCENCCNSAAGGNQTWPLSQTVVDGHCLGLLRAKVRMGGEQRPLVLMLLEILPVAVLDADVIWLRFSKHETLTPKDLLGLSAGNHLAKP